MNGTASHQYALLLAAEDERARARSTFALGMIGGLILTLAFNLAAPLVTKSVPLTLVAYAMPPLLAGWGAHAAVTVWKHLPRTPQSLIVARAAVGLSVVLLLVALVASYTHIRHVFLVAGMEPWLATTFAVTIDVALLMATLAWFALRPTPQPELDAARERLMNAERESAEAEADTEHSERVRMWLDAERVHRDQSAAAHSECVRMWLDAEREARTLWLDAERVWKMEQRHLDTERPVQEPVHRSASTAGHKPSTVPSTVTWTLDDAEQLAEQLVSSGRVNAEVSTVRRALEMFSEGESGRSVAAALSISATTASAWRRAAAELDGQREHRLVAV